ncbi:MAG: hypothetical protein G01um101448_98 [Parcubacteria group bacterium Gr01-1014_48]|nr:MAG: hypothetical protein Greene041614_19 [Parcubacteria group bacterium Greene0416_14]TSC74457.1 MAG: hypothetical protein G01um101448_98 [Parcubacteria group bacterium Gr01-1014_48]TSD01767.1 MAG: hypothetical protein Greene101415_25 [Parcubacteria group bacterium Greene1014_15]TSD08481.1 MAG: hypothetical protein Greene07144_20 [Parcubacteria group bacterium Greene0714_4]
MLTKDISEKQFEEDAMEIYEAFKEKEGSEHIATPLSICAVLKLAAKSENVLEIGAGIGTLSYAILAHSRAALTTYEDNFFCIEQLKKNLQMFDGRFKLLTSYMQMPSSRHFDLVIVDGANGQNHDGGYKRFIHDLFSGVYPKIVYIEGVRRPQRRMIRETLRGRYALWVKKILYRGEYKGGTLYYCYRAPWIIREIKNGWNEIREHPRLEKYFSKIKPPKALPLLSDRR